MPPITVDQVRNLGDFATIVDWELQFITVPSGLNNLSDAVFLRCESSDIPKKTGTSTSIQIRGLVPVKQPGIYAPPQTLTLTCNETVDNAIAQQIANWREMCYQTGTGVAGRTQDVKAKLRLKRLNRQKVGIWYYDLEGVFLEDYDAGGQLGSTSADVLKPVLTLSYDDFKEGAL
ncbi:hypothetical protein [Escherichia phage EP_H11]|nr:hypothetical protein [Escherichia phage EP_H11]